ncbi:MAG TPA: FAD-linked oxidase C-terminal domain-containing protein [Pyrinomonadaceae bacterium]|jgi:glycolate oxidase|nr:FAD-linked oxidase C-terminal domain-containing protein [Pyrinomonadaceae bacterium]
MSRSIHFADAGKRARTAASDACVVARLCEIVGAEHVLVDEARVEPYAQDAVKEKFPPEAVVLPCSAREVSEILRLANERSFPVTARGGGVGYTGGAVPVEGGIVVGTDRMNRIKEIDLDNLYAVTEPGVTTYALQQAVERLGLFYPPDPASYKDSFIGGNIAENAGGIRSAKYGVTKHYVLGLEVVLPTGEIVRTGGRTSKNVVGFDLTGLLCGSEGMLGIITEATLRLLPLPEATRTVRATFRTMRAACACPPVFTRARVTPVAIEVLDRNAIRAVESEFAFGLGDEAGALLLVAVDGPAAEVEREARVVEEVVKEAGGYDVIRSESRETEDRLWDVRRALSPSIKKFGTLKFNEDVVVPRSRVPELVERVEEIGRRHNTFVVNFGHLGDGNIHVNFMCDRSDSQAVARARAAVGETFAAAVELGGTISGEHGIGYVKAPYLEMALSGATIEAMRRIKRALDPRGILNPGKVFSAESGVLESEV